MSDKLLIRITSIIAIALLAVSVVLVALVYVGPSGAEIENAGGDILSIPVYTDGLLYWAYALLVTTALVTIVFAITKFVKNLINNPKGSIKTLVFIGAFALIFIVSWCLGSPEEMSILGYEGDQNFGTWIQLTDMLIYTCYTLLALVILTIVGSQIYVKLK